MNTLSFTFLFLIHPRSTFLSTGCTSINLRSSAKPCTPVPSNGKVSPATWSTSDSAQISSSSYRSGTTLGYPQLRRLRVMSRMMRTRTLNAAIMVTERAQHPLPLTWMDISRQTMKKRRAVAAHAWLGLSLPSQKGLGLLAHDSDVCHLTMSQQQSLFFVSFFVFVSDFGHPALSPPITLFLLFRLVRTSTVVLVSTSNPTFLRTFSFNLFFFSGAHSRGRGALPFCVYLLRCPLEGSGLSRSHHVVVM